MKSSNTPRFLSFFYYIALIFPSCVAVLALTGGLLTFVTQTFSLITALLTHQVFSWEKGLLAHIISTIIGGIMLYILRKVHKQWIKNDHSIYMVGSLSICWVFAAIVLLI